MAIEVSRKEFEKILKNQKRDIKISQNNGGVMRNKLADLNNYLFEQLERLNDEDLNEEEDIIKSGGNKTAFYSFWLCYKVALSKTFNAIPNSGREGEVERLDVHGNVILNNHWNLFNMGENL